MALKPLEGIHEEEREDAERQQRGGILRPALLLVLANAAQLVDQHLERPEDWMQEGALALEQPRHEQPDRLRDEQDQAKEHENLQDSVAGHRKASELLGPEHGPAEIHEQEHRDGAGHDVIEHETASLHPITRFRDRPERAESRHSDHEVEQIKHRTSPCARRPVDEHHEVAGRLERAAPLLGLESATSSASVVRRRRSGSAP